MFCLVFFFFFGGGGGILSRRRLHILCFFLYENNFWKLRQAKFSLDTDILQFALEAAKHKQGRENEKFSSFINYLVMQRVVMIDNSWMGNLKEFKNEKLEVRCDPHIEFPIILF